MSEIPLLPRLSNTKQEEIDKALVNMIILDLMPLSCVEKEGFQKFVETLRPNYGIPSRGKLTKLIQEHYLHEKSKLINFCKAQGKYLTYTTDLWKSAAKEYYISVAVHFIDDDWNLHSPLLATKHITGDHKKATIGKLVAEIIRPFLGPRSKVHSGVTDGGEITSIKHTAASLPKENKYMRKSDRSHVVL